MINRNHQSIINEPPTGYPDIESTPFPQHAIRGVSRHHGAANDLLRKPTDSPRTHLTSNRAIRLSAASGTTVNREGDGRIRKGLESLDGR